jgi:hypothetical protein
MPEPFSWREDDEAKEDFEDLIFLYLVYQYTAEIRKEKTSSPYRYREPSDYTKFS